MFSCPCGKREVYVVDIPGDDTTHTISFDDDEKLTIKGSCGYAAKPELGRKANWCHLAVTDGKITSYDDAECPGRDL